MRKIITDQNKRIYVIDWLIDGSISWLVGWHVGWLIGSLIDWSVVWLFVWLPADNHNNLQDLNSISSIVTRIWLDGWSAFFYCIWLFWPHSKCSSTYFYLFRSFENFCDGAFRGRRLVLFTTTVKNVVCMPADFRNSCYPSGRYTCSGVTDTPCFIFHS